MARIAWFAAGLAVAAGAAYFARSLWVPPPVVEKPRVLMVRTGTIYGSIAAAMADAKAGDTVEVPPGEYSEEVHLAEGVTLRAQVLREAVLRAAPLSSGPAVVAENIKGARFIGFRIAGTKERPIATGLLLSNASVEVDDVEVEGAGIGVEIRGAANPVLRADSIHDCANEGVLILGPSQAWISHNDLRRNKGAGLAAGDGARPRLVGNIFEKNAVDVPPDLLPAVKEQNLLVDVPAPAHKAAPAAKKEK